MGASVPHRLQGQPHTRFPAAMAQRLARLLVHGDSDVGVDDFTVRGQIGVGGEHRFNASLIADEQEPHVGVMHERKRGAGNCHPRPEISPHRIDRYDPRLSHDHQSIFQPRPKPAPSMVALPAHMEAA